MLTTTKSIARSVIRAAVEPLSPLAGLRLLAVANAADKPAHYLQHYTAHFGPLRHRRLRVLEIGIGGYEDPCAGGGSLRMWAGYFWRSRIVGIDIHDKSPHKARRIVTAVGSQNDPGFLRRLSEKYGPWDIIIDDGSHVSEHVITAFRSLYGNYLADGGWYVVEDLHTSYWPQFHGETDVTSVDFLKGLADASNAQFLPRGTVPFGGSVGVVAFYPEIAFIQKGRPGRPVPEFLRHEIGIAVERMALAGG